MYYIYYKRYRRRQASRGLFIPRLFLYHRLHETRGTMSEDAGRHLRRKRYRGAIPGLSRRNTRNDTRALPRGRATRVGARGHARGQPSLHLRRGKSWKSSRPSRAKRRSTRPWATAGTPKEILAAILPGGRLFGFDLDPIELSKAARRLEGEGIPEGAFVPVHANFASLAEVLSDAGLVGADLFLADLGVSSMQIDDPDRGFSFKRKGPLDMRMDPERGHSAREFLMAVSEAELREALRANADEAEAESIAHAICLRRGRLVHDPRPRGGDLLRLPDAGLQGQRDAEDAPPLVPGHPYRGERGVLRPRGLLASLPSCLNPGARAAILSFHSGEDRRIETAFRAGLENGIYSAVSTETIRPSREEQYGNPRSSSAKLRWAIRSAENK